MNKYLVLALIGLFTQSSYSQVYLSKIYNDILILGPNNVAPHCDEIAMSYVAEIEGLYDVLIKEEEELKKSVSDLAAIEAPTKAQLFTLGEQQNDKALIEEELTTLMQFKELWLKIVDQTPVKLELIDIIRSGQCAEIRSNHGTYSHKEYMVTLDKNIEVIKVVEHFTIEQRDSIPQWITKVSENCISKDPEDCKMWCFVNQEGGEVLVDFTGDLYRLKDSKIASQFNIDSQSNFASRELTIDLEGATIDIINVVKSDNNMLLQLDGFTTVDCKE